jgi:hypothetical protein
MSDFLAKPLRQGELLSALVRAMDDAEERPRRNVSKVSDHGGALDLKAALEDIDDIDLLVTMARMFLSEWDEYLERLNEALKASPTERFSRANPSAQME